jgi:hypothetical protein
VNATRQDPKAILAQARGVANETASDTGEILSGLQKFVDKTGDLKMGRDIMKDMAVWSKATGSNLADMSSAAADVAGRLPETADKAQKISAIMGVLAAQGKLGAVAMPEQARILAGVATRAPEFAGDASANIAILGGLMQGARQGGGARTGTMAATAIGSFANSLSKARTEDAYKKATHKSIYTDKTHTSKRDARDIILDAINATKGDQLALQKIFGDAKAMQVIRPYATEYTKVRTAGGSHEEAMAAAKAEVNRFTGAIVTAAERTESFNRRMADTDSKMQLINNRYEEAADGFKVALLPVIEALGGPVMAGLTALGSVLGVITGTKEENRQKEGSSADIEMFNAQSELAAEVKAGKGIKPGTLERVRKAKSRGEKALGEAGERAAEEAQPQGYDEMSALTADSAKADPQTTKSIQSLGSGLSNLSALLQRVESGIKNGTLKVEVVKEPAKPPAAKRGNQHDADSDTGG